MTTPGARDVGIAIVLLTICVMAGACVILPALGYPIEQGTVTVVFGLFGAAAAGVTTWIAKSQIESANKATTEATARADALQQVNAQMAVQMAALQISAVPDNVEP